MYRSVTVVLVVMTTLGGPLPVRGQTPEAAALPVVTIDGPTVILFSTDPDEVSDPDARMGLYSALDQQQTMMADSRESLNALGMVDLTQPGRAFVVRDADGDRVFTASPDSSVVGYLLVAPGREFQVLYRVQFPDMLIPAARAYLEAGPGGDTMYGLIGKIEAVPGARDALAEILLRGVSGMPGCLSYIVAQDPEDPDALWVTEVWDSQESHTASLSLPSVQEAIREARPLIAGFSERRETRPVGGYGLNGI